MEEQFLVLKLGNVPGVDFYKEHTQIIEEYGFVDFARRGKRKPNMESYSSKIMFIKEGRQNGNRLLKATIKEIHPIPQKWPTYYNNMVLDNAFWCRISALSIVNMDEFNSKFTTKSGKEIDAVLKSSAKMFAVTYR